MFSSATAATERGQGHADGTHGAVQRPELAFSLTLGGEWIVLMPESLGQHYGWVEDLRCCIRSCKSASLTAMLATRDVNPRSQSGVNAGAGAGAGAGGRKTSLPTTV